MLKRPTVRGNHLLLFAIMLFLVGVGVFMLVNNPNQQNVNAVNGGTPSPHGADW